MYSEKHKICMTISQGRKKNILYKETKEMGRCTIKIYIHVCSHMGIQKMSHKSKAKCTGFQCKAFCACM